MSKDKSRLDFIQDAKLCVIGGDYFTVIDADTDGPEYRYKKAETVREAIDNAMSEIGVSQGAESHGWIKCSERLPDKCTAVLLYVDDHEYPHITIGMLNTDGNFGHCDDFLSDDVTYWQPLPQLPID